MFPRYPSTRFAGFHGSTKVGWDAMKSITNIDDLQEARSAPRALVFIWVNWAVQARQSEAALNKLRESWQCVFPQHPIPMYRADLSDQEGEVWDAIRALLETEGRPVDPLTYGGNGALLWMSAGKILIHSVYLAQLEAPKLLLVTRSVFEVSEPLARPYHTLNCRLRQDANAQPEGKSEDRGRGC